MIDLLTYDQITQDQDQKILTAIRNIVLEAHITPQTTLATRPDQSLPASIGGTDVWVTDPSVFTAGGPFEWGDMSGEEDLTIQSGWQGNNPVPLTFTGLDYQGLVYNHQPGGVVFANLFDYSPAHLDHMTDNDEPVCWVDADRESNSQRTFSQNAPTLFCTLDFRVSLVQQRPLGPDASFMDANVFVKRARRRCKHGLDTIKLALWQRWQLANQLDTYQSMGFGDWQNPSADLFTKTWRENVAPENQLYYVGRASFPVMGNYIFLNFQ